MPVIEVSYQRQYFQLRNMRITFDSNIRYREYEKLIDYCDNEAVVEFKCPANVSMEMLRDEFNISFSRFSKYCRGILKTGRL